MNPNTDEPEDGERRRVLAIDGEMSGRDAIVDFADLDRPGLTYRAVVMRGQVRGGLAVGDQCVLRYQGPRRRHNLIRAATWLFIERTEDAYVDFDAEVVAMTAQSSA